MSAIDIGVDLGGTKIEAVALASDGGELCRERVPTPRGDYQATLSAVSSLVRHVSQGLLTGPPKAVGIGIPGSLSPRTGLVRNANSTWINGKPFKRDIEAELGCPVIIANDANCLALSEAADGAAAGFGTVFAVILGTGVGGGVVANGEAIGGRNAVAGEWGHNPLPWRTAAELPGPHCFCGRYGCIETFLSGPALEQQYRAIAGNIADAKTIAARATEGDALCGNLLDVYSIRLAKALATVVNVIDPDVIVFGGGLSNIPYILSTARENLSAWVFSDTCETEFRVSRWGDSSGVRGAARLVSSWSV